jgi:putative transposase
MPRWRLFYHVVWTTCDREPLIEAAWEKALHGYLWGKADALGCIPHAVGGIEDHVHLALSIPPRLAVATVVGRLKGASSHHVSHALTPGGAFAWQAEYGVFSFSERALPRVVAYVHDQRNHHAAGTLWPKLEDAS